MRQQRPRHARASPPVRARRRTEPPRVIDAGVDASAGSVGDGYNDALAETTIGLFKTEKINRGGGVGDARRRASW
jgi:hypothetical protein